MGHKNKTKDFSGKISVYVMITCMIFNLHTPAALAGPEGAQVVNGQVSFEQSGLNTTITASDKAIVNYSRFDIAQPEIVEFVQPSSSASVLNRILSANPTSIDGTLLANGRVFFVNPAGVIIGSGARINVNQLVASALNISNSDFINGRYNFAGGSGSVINHGDISAEKVYLIGKQVANSGTISCPTGYVIMTAGDKVFIGEIGSDVVVEIDVPSLPEPVGPIEGSAVLNEGTVEVGNGTIVLAAAGDIYSRAISNVGTLSASVDAGNAGQIKLVAADGQIINTGAIEATSNTAAGGVVTVEGEEIINAGTVDVTGAEGGQVAIEAARLGQFGTINADGTDADGGTINLVAGEIAVAGIDSLTTANAGLNGDGGEIKVLADMDSGFAGLAPGASLQAKGGAESGDGGFIELSAANFQTLADIDISAQNGEYGTFLLDPIDIYIRDSANNSQDYNAGGGTNPFTDYGGQGLSFTAAEDNTDGDGTANEIASGYLVSLSGNIILQAQNDIIIDQITGTPLTWGTLANLTLQAGRHIQFSNAGGFTVNTAGGYIHLEADSPHYLSSYDGTGTINLGRVTLTTGGGNVIMIGKDFIMDNATVNAGGGTVIIGPRVTGMPMELGYASAMLKNAELGNITAGSLVIGRAQTAGDDGAGTNAQIFTAGKITADDVIAPAGWNTLTLYGNALEDSTSENGIQVGTLNLLIGGSIGIPTDPFNTNIGTSLAIDTGSSPGNVHIYNLGTLILGGVSVGNGLLNITANSPITVGAPGITVSGDVTLTTNDTGGAGIDNIDVQASITSGGNVYLRAGDDILLNGGTIRSQPLGGSAILTSAYGGAGDGGSITGTATTIVADNITLQVAGTAPGNIGASGSPIQVNCRSDGTGTYGLTLTTGDNTDTADDIYVAETNGDLYMEDVTITTPTGAQEVYIENSSGIIDVDSPINTDDNLSLYTTGTTKAIIFSYTAGTAITSTGNVTLNATGAIRDKVTDSPAVIDIIGQTVSLTAASGGIGTPATGTDGVLEITANTALNANTTSDNSNININSIAANIPVGLIDAGTGTVTLNATAGATDYAIQSVSDDGTADIVASTTNLTATAIGTTSALEVDTDTLNANTTTANGNIVIDLLNDNTLIGLVTAGTGNVTLDATTQGTDYAIDSASNNDTADIVASITNLYASSIGTITTLEVDTDTLNASTTGGDIEIDLLNDDTLIGLVDAGSSDVTLDATAGPTTHAIDSVNNDNTADIVADTINLFAGTGGIGNSSPLDVTATTQLNANTTAANSDITIDSIGNLPIGIVTAGVGGGIVTLDSTGNMTDAEGTGPPEVANIIGTSAALSASTGIGNNEAPSDEDIDTDITNLAAQTESGDIHIENSGDLTIGTVGSLSGVEITDAGADVGVDDHITIRATSPLTVDDPVTNNDGGNITLAAEGTAVGDDLDINANITATGGNGVIELYAGDSMDIAGTVTIQAVTGNIELRAPEHIDLSILNTSSNVIVTADYDGRGGGMTDGTGAISDNLAGEAANITGETAILQAGSGIGDAGGTLDIETDITNLEAATVTGGIYVTDIAEGLTIGGISSLVGARITGLGTDIEIVALSPLTVNETVSGPGNITLTASESGVAGDDLTLNANVTSTGGIGAAINLNAGDHIIQMDSWIVQINGGQINATANMDAGSIGDFTQTDGASFVSGGGPITVSCYDAELSLLDAGTTGTVSVTATGGGIADNTATENANIIGAIATLLAETGIGASDIETSATSISADTTDGDVDIHNTHASPVTVTSLTTGDGDIMFAQDGGGDLTVNTATTGNGGVWITGADNVQLTGGTLAATDIIDVRSQGGNLTTTASSIIADNGTYDGTIGDPPNTDDRPSINFLDEPSWGMDPGIPFDLAIYLASSQGDVTFDSTVTIADGRTMVLDAFDTVTFGLSFDGSAFDATDRLEACSRISETLGDALDLITLPYVDEFGAGNPPWPTFYGDYVLRGGLPDAWVLQWTLPVREQPPIAFDLIAFGPERIDDPNLPVRPEAGLENAYLHHTDVLAPLEP